MTTCCVLAHNLNYSVDYFNVKACDIWKGKCDNKEGH